MLINFVLYILIILIASLLDLLVMINTEGFWERFWERRNKMNGKNG